MISTDALRTRLSEKFKGEFNYFWAEHTVVLLAYLGLSIGLTWPLLRDFNTKILGVGDGKHLLWTLWHVSYALFEGESLFDTSLLYYPLGISLLTHGMGPLLGIISLPFWLWSQEAAYNSVILMSSVLSGYGLYLLARSLKFESIIAFFAGLFLLMAPIRIFALPAGHVAQGFIALPPLALLATHNAFQPQKSAWWAIGSGVVLLLTLLHIGEQFLFTTIAVSFFIVVYFFYSNSANRTFWLRRTLLIGVSALVLCAPILIATLRAIETQALSIERNQEALNHHPDLIQFLLPGEYHRFLGPVFTGLLHTFIKSPVETAIFLSWIGLFLTVLAVLSRRKQVWPWLLLTGLSMVISLGPFLTVFGKSRVTDYDLPILLPFAFLTSLPGLGFWRTPGRFMAIGYIGLGITASFGLLWLQTRLPAKLGRWLPTLVIGLFLLETWPISWSQYLEPLRPIPKFYQDIAHETDDYGVFDLPIRPYQAIDYFSWHVYYSSFYQVYQTTHHKGIAAGYISRSYPLHPLFAQFVSDSVADSPLQTDVLINNQPANRYANARYELAQNNYRYVVFHKPQPDYVTYKSEAWGETVAQKFIQELFGQQPPLIDDELTQVYEIYPIAEDAELTQTIALYETPESNWHEYQSGKRLAISPATFYVASPQTEPAWLEIEAHKIMRASGEPIDQTLITVTTADSDLDSTFMEEFIPGQSTVLPIMLPAGSGVLTITTVPTAAESAANSQDIRFEIRQINLQTWSGGDFPRDILINQKPQEHFTYPGRAVFGTGWYGEMPTMERWAKSPASLLIYSPFQQQAQLKLQPAFIHDPMAERGLGNQGILRISVNYEPQKHLIISTDTISEQEIPLQAGWNRVTLALETGNFVPSDYGESNETALVSFAIKWIALTFPK